MWFRCQSPGDNQIALDGSFKRHSRRVLSSRGLGIVFNLDRLRAISVHLSEYRAPIATAGLFTRDELHGLSLDANLLGQGLNKRKRGTNGTRAYPTVILTRTAGLSDNA